MAFKKKPAYFQLQVCAKTILGGLYFIFQEAIFPFQNPQAPLNQQEILVQGWHASERNTNLKKQTKQKEKTLNEYTHTHTHIHTLTSHFAIQQRLAQHCKSIVLS